MKSNLFAVALTVIGFAISTAATAGFVDSRSEPADEAKQAQPEKADAVSGGAAAAPVAAEPLPQAPATVTLRAGKRMDEELRRLVPVGLTVEAVSFVLPGDFIVTNEFESAVSELMRAANAAGVRVRARFYHGNKVLRVVEY